MAMQDRMQPVPRFRPSGSSGPRPANGREWQAVRAWKLLGRRRVVAFLRAALPAEESGRGGPLAVELINGDLDEGRGLEEIFLTGEDLGFRLGAKEAGEDEFEISFGCQAGPTAGDGGRWRVLFDESGRVVECEQVGYWLS